MLWGQARQLFCRQACCYAGRRIDKRASLCPQVIQELSDRQRFAVVPSFVGHGVGWHFHSAPVVSPVRNREPGVMVPGQTFTIEPILVEGGTRSKVLRPLHTTGEMC